MPDLLRIEALRAGYGEPVVLPNMSLSLREGQVLLAKNSAPIPHNVHWTGGAKNPGNNVIIPPGNEVKITDLMTSPYPVSVKCDIHGWMNASVRVFDHPYFAVTNENGEFEIKDAPAGKYRLVMWHEEAGWVNGGKTGQEVEIKAGGTTEVNEKPTPDDK